MTQREQLTAAQNEQYEFIVRVLSIPGIEGSDLFWRVDNGTISVAVNCNDAFYWATSDCEEITPANIGMTEQAMRDGGEIYGDLLFACRVRKMRPQTPMLDKMPAELKPLFEACGPYRTPKECG